MSTTIQIAPERATANIAEALRAGGLPLPAVVNTGTEAAPSFVLMFAEDLTAQQLAQANTILKLATGATLLTEADYASLAPRLDTGRLFLTQSQADFIAKAQNVRDRELFDNVSALWRVIFRLLRD